MNQNLSEAAMNWEAIQINIQFPIFQAHPDEEVDHEEDVEAKVDLLGRVLQPRNTRLHIVTAIVRMYSSMIPGTIGVPKGEKCKFSFNFSGKDAN